MYANRSQQPLRFNRIFILFNPQCPCPAGIAAKTKFGDILANVDVLHGSSESLLTLSNFLLAFGFAAAVAGSRDLSVFGGAGAKQEAERDGSGGVGGGVGSMVGGEDTARADVMSPALALVTLIAVVGPGR